MDSELSRDERRLIADPSSPDRARLALQLLRRRGERWSDRTPDEWIAELRSEDGARARLAEDEITARGSVAVPLLLEALANFECDNVTVLHSRGELGSPFHHRVAAALIRLGDHCLAWWDPLLAGLSDPRSAWPIRRYLGQVGRAAVPLLAAALPQLPEAERSFVLGVIARRTDDLRDYVELLLDHFESLPGSDLNAAERFSSWFYQRRVPGAALERIRATLGGDDRRLRRRYAIAVVDCDLADIYARPLALAVRADAGLGLAIGEMLQRRMAPHAPGIDRLARHVLDVLVADGRHELGALACEMARQSGTPGLELRAALEADPAWGDQAIPAVVADPPPELVPLLQSLYENTRHFRTRRRIVIEHPAAVEHQLVRGVLEEDEATLDVLVSVDLHATFGRLSDEGAALRAAVLDRFEVATLRTLPRLLKILTGIRERIRAVDRVATMLRSRDARTRRIGVELAFATVGSPREIKGILLEIFRRESDPTSSEVLARGLAGMMTPTVRRSIVESLGEGPVHERRAAMRLLRARSVGLISPAPGTWRRWLLDEDREVRRLALLSLDELTDAGLRRVVPEDALRAALGSQDRPLCAAALRPSRRFGLDASLIVEAAAALLDAVEPREAAEVLDGLVDCEWSPEEARVLEPSLTRASERLLAETTGSSRDDILFALQEIWDRCRSC